MKQRRNLGINPRHPLLPWKRSPGRMADGADSSAPSEYTPGLPWFSSLIESVSDRLHAPYPIAIAILVAGLYGTGFLIATAEADEHAFLADYLLGLGMIGLFYVACSAEWGSRRARRQIWDARQSFDDGYTEIYRKMWERVCDPKDSLVLVGPVVATATGYVTAVRISGGSLLEIVPTSHYIVMGPPLLFAYLLVVLFVFGAITGVCIYGIVMLVWFCEELRPVPLRPRSFLIRDSSLEELALTSFWLSVFVFGGIVIGIAGFYGNINEVSSLLVGLGGFLGFFVFLTPQLAIHHAIMNSKRSVMAEIQGKIPETGSVSTLVEDPNLRSMLAFLHQVDGVKECPIDVRFVLTEGVVTVGPLLFTLLIGGSNLRPG